MTVRIPNAMNNAKAGQADSELAAAQWAEWRSSRRRFIQMGAMGGAAIAAAGFTSGATRFTRSVAAQDTTPKSGGSISMSLADDDVQNFDPIIPTDNMSI